MLLKLGLHSATALAAYAHATCASPQGPQHCLPEAIHPLTRRECAIAAHLFQGRTSKEIARRLHISHQTVRKHRENLHRKLGVRTSAQLLAALQRPNDAPAQA